MKRVGLLSFLLASLLFPAAAKRNHKRTDIEVTDLAVRRGDGDVTLDGHIRNTGSKNLARIILFFDFTAPDGEMVTTKDGGIDQGVLAPGADGEFHAKLADPARAVRVVVRAQSNGERDLRVGQPGPYPIE